MNFNFRGFRGVLLGDIPIFLSCAHGGTGEAMTILTG
jgi:hypothetical protein